MLLYFSIPQISPSENLTHPVGTRSLEVILGVIRTWKYDLPPGVGQYWGGQLVWQVDAAL